MEYDSATKRNECVILATWMNLEDILSEISPTRKDKYCVIPLIGGSRTGKFRDGKQNAGYEGLEGGSKRS